MNATRNGDASSVARPSSPAAFCSVDGCQLAQHPESEAHIFARRVAHLWTDVFLGADDSDDFVRPFGVVQAEARIASERS